MVESGISIVYAVVMLVALVLHVRDMYIHIKW